MRPPNVVDEEGAQRATLGAGSDIFSAVAYHPRLLAAALHCIADRFCLSDLCAREPDRGGHGGQALHMGKTSSLCCDSFAGPLCVRAD